MTHIFLSVFLLAFALPAWATTYKIHDDVIGKVSRYQVQREENLYQIARRFDIGIVELLAANPTIEPSTLKAGTELTLTTMHVLPPGRRQGIVINLSELRLFYYADDETVMTFPIGIGREGWQTPLGATTIAKKRPKPSWTPPESIREESPELPEVMPAGPSNPLGNYALNLAWSGYLIHGTNRPYSVGKRSSHGCIRLYPEDIEKLFEMVEEGTPVTIIDVPYKLGWKGNTLWLEITPNQQQSDVIAAYSQPLPLNIPELYEVIQQVGDGADINWYAAERAIAHHSGIPVIIAKR